MAVIESIKELRDAMRAGAVLTQEQQYWPNGTLSKRVTDCYVLRDAGGKQLMLYGSVVNRAIHAGKIRHIPGTSPVRYEFKPEADE